MSARDALIGRVHQYTTDPDQPLRQHAYRTPLRDERLAAILGASLGVLFSVCFLTGLYSHLHQHPLSWLPVPSRPAGLYRVTATDTRAITPLLQARLQLSAVQPW